MTVYEVTREEKFISTREMTYGIEAESEEDAKEKLYAAGDGLIPVYEHEVDFYLDDVDKNMRNWEVKKA